MKILLDIGHPAHVHYFKNFVKIMKERGHEFLITARNKEVSFQLLDSLYFQYVSRGKGGKSLIGKLFYIIKADLILLKHAMKFKPDLFLSFSSTYAAHVSKMLRKPHVTLDDTEHAKFELLMYPPFTDTILNPSCFYKDLGKKQIRFNGYMELAYLHPKYFKADEKILDYLGISKGIKYTIIRFVSWNASHDIGQGGIQNDQKFKLVKELLKYSKVFISSENKLPNDLLKYQVKIKPDQLHDVLKHASLYIGEGATTASECAMLGIPAIYVNTLSAGTLEEQEKYGLIYSFRNYHGVIDKAIEILKNNDSISNQKKLRDNMFREKIDVTGFMVWFIENYPESVKLMKEYPGYQDRFKNTEEPINN